MLCDPHIDTRSGLVAGPPAPPCVSAHNALCDPHGFRDEVIVLVSGGPFDVINDDDFLRSGIVYEAQAELLL